jgi:maltose 6'-phosphate phosphatase
MYRLIFLVSCVLCLTSCIEWAHDNSRSKKISIVYNDDDERADSIRIKIANFNAGTGSICSPDKAAKILFPYNFDIVCFNEIPQGNWIDRVGMILGLNYSIVGKVSSANQKNKYKGILSRYPIKNSNEFMLNSTGWNPASIINGIIEKNSNLFAIYSLQIAGSKGEKGSYANMIATNILQRIKNSRLIIAGDCDNTPDDEAMLLFNEHDINNIWNDVDYDKTVESSLYTGGNNNKGIVDHIFYSSISRSHTLKAGFIEVKPNFSNHKIVWALLEFPPPRVKKNRL